ncbi:MAG: SH3 domain-containing protein [Deltaproteobacteria bacterium]|nr:SH3 domain-containing protein [Deltaproteobacteria bacterium]
MRRPVFLKHPGWCFLGLALLALWLAPGIALGETLKVCQPNQCLYPDPDFAGTSIVSVPEGAAVNVLEQKGDWYKVEYQGKSGWINRQAFPAPEKSSKFSLGGILGIAPVKETSSDEAALAGKGFTPEVEASYKSKHPEMKFAEVDKVEANTVDPAKLQAFIKEGGLTP